MKPYGHKRKDSKTCSYGCCGFSKGNVENRNPVKRKAVDKAAKRRARQHDKQLSKEEQ